MLRVGGWAALLWLGVQWPVSALEISQSTAADSRSAVVLFGDIVSGDADRLVEFIDANFVKKTRSLAAIYIDSNGGVLGEGTRIADIVHRLGVTVVVANGAACKSSCMLILAGAIRRVVGRQADLAVHSTSVNEDALAGRGPVEDSDTMAATLTIARLYHWYGVPDSVVVRLVTTLPSGAYTLTEADKALLRTSSSP